jgi:hypothetical protein
MFRYYPTLFISLALAACNSAAVDTEPETTTTTTTSETGTTSTSETGTITTTTTTTPKTAKVPKVLMMMIDGFIPEGIDTSDTPTIDKLLIDAAWSRTARAESTTISGSGWSSFLTGVHWDKHQVSSNDFTYENYSEYPHVFTRLKELKPDAVVAECQIWEPIWTGLVEPANPDYVSHHNYDDYADDYLDDDSSDWLCSDDVAAYASEPDVDFLVMMYGDLDGVGHTYGYGADYSTYQTMLTKIDTAMGEIIDAIEARPTFEDEDWLILLSADHAGSPDLGHGYNIPEHREIPLIINGPSVTPGEIWPAPQTVDIVPTAMHHLGVTAKEAWGIDGVVVGFEETQPPTAALNENLIFNGDAEYESGTVGYDGVPDVSIAGWSDPGYFTVIQWDSPGGYPVMSDDGPPDRGDNLFAGGETGSDSYASWTVDLNPLAKEIASGAQYDLSGWLGGYYNQDDAIRVTVQFFNGASQPVGSDSIGPVLAAERANLTGLIEKTTAGTVPKDARSATVTLDAIIGSGWNDGYADNISLILSAP